MEMTTEWTPQGDPLLAMLPAEHPFGFNRLPFAEQQWRGRCFLIFYTTSGGRVAYAWWQAMREDEDGATEKFITERVTDQEILDGLAGLEEIRRIEAQPPTGVQG